MGAARPHRLCQFAGGCPDSQKTIRSLRAMLPRNEVSRIAKIADIPQLFSQRSADQDAAKVIGEKDGFQHGIADLAGQLKILSHGAIPKPSSGKSVSSIFALSIVR